MLRKRALFVEILEDRTVPTLLGQSLFPANNPWNQSIANAPVAANSAAIINNIVTVYGNNRLHPDFGQDSHAAGQDLYGIPFNIVHGNSVTHSTVVIDAYADESDLIATPIPANVVLEGDFQNGPNVGVNNRGDSHLIIWDVDNNIAYEFYRASRPSENTDGHWHADQESVWNMNTNTFRTLGYTSADAAGLSILAGLVRPDEGLPVSEGGQGVINHAIRFTLQNSIILNKFIYPASHIANSNTNAAIEPPMGARFRLKASVDITALNPESRVIAQAMKTYGMIVADNGSNFFFSGASDSVNASNQQTLTWNDNDIQDTLHGLKSLHYSDFEVVDLTPVVTGLSATQGQSGQQITVIGQNFSGAAGNLHVSFGSTQATSVTYVDDSHLLVTVPSGTGTVDVRVQSGNTVAANSQNIKSPTFGYGISTTNVNDHFTFSSGPTPAVSSVVINGGSIVTVDSFGRTPNLAGQNSVVEQILVTFNESVTLDAGAFSVVNLHGSVTVRSGVAPNTLPVSVNVSAVTGSNNTQFVLTFAGPGAIIRDNSAAGTGGIGNISTTIKDGFYQLLTDGSKVHANGQTAVSNTKDFWALYGAGNPNDYVLSGNPTFAGSVITVASAGFQDLFNTYNSQSNVASGPPYNAWYDANLDGNIDSADFQSLFSNYGTEWDL